MLWTIDFLVLQEDAVVLAGAHEVVVTGARGEAASDCGPWLLTLLAALSRSTTETCFKCLSDQYNLNTEWELARDKVCSLTSCFPLSTAM